MREAGPRAPRRRGPARAWLLLALAFLWLAASPSPAARAQERKAPPKAGPAPAPPLPAPLQILPPAVPRAQEGGRPRGAGEDELGKAAQLLRKKAEESKFFWERGALLHRSGTFVDFHDLRGVRDDLFGLFLGWRDFVAGLPERYAHLTPAGIARFVSKSFGSLLLLVLALFAYRRLGAWLARRTGQAPRTVAGLGLEAAFAAACRLGQAALPKLLLLAAVYLSIEIFSVDLALSVTWDDKAEVLALVVFGGAAAYAFLRTLVRQVVFPPGEGPRPFAASREAADSVRPAALRILAFCAWTLIPIASFEALAYRPGFVALLWTVFWIGMVMIILTVASQEVIHVLLRPVAGREQARRLLSTPGRAYRMALLVGMGLLLLLYGLGFRNLTQYIVTGLVFSGLIVALGRGLLSRAEARLRALFLAGGEVHRRFGMDLGHLDRLSGTARVLARWAIYAAVAVVLMVLWGVDLYALAWLLAVLVTPVAEVGGVGISVANVVKVGVIFAVFVWLSRYLRDLIHTRMDESFGGEGMRGNIALGVRYLVLALGAVAALKSVGVDFTTLTIFAGVIGLGVGFGLQTIANNLISGVILLLERTVKPGDFIEVGNTTGVVQQVALRSTIVRTLDNISVIVPNSNFVSNNVINWSHGDKTTRGRISVGVAYGSDLEKVRRCLLEAASSNPLVLGNRPPQVILTGFGDSAINLELLYWVGEPRDILYIKSDLMFAVEAAFRREGIRIPFPQREVRVYREEPPSPGGGGT